MTGRHVLVDQERKSLNSAGPVVAAQEMGDQGARQAILNAEKKKTGRSAMPDIVRGFATLGGAGHIGSTGWEAPSAWMSGLLMNATANTACSGGVVRPDDIDDLCPETGGAVDSLEGAATCGLRSKLCARSARSWTCSSPMRSAHRGPGTRAWRLCGLRSSSVAVMDLLRPCPGRSTAGRPGRGSSESQPHRCAARNLRAICSPSPDRPADQGGPCVLVAPSGKGRRSGPAARAWLVFTARPQGQDDPAPGQSAPAQHGTAGRS